MSFSKKIISNYQPKRLAVKLNSKGEQSVVKGHPWVFSNSIVKINEDAITGDLAIIFSKNKNKVIGLGFYDAKSPIRIKIIHSENSKADINAVFFHHKIELAFDKRKELLVYVYTCMLPEESIFVLVVGCFCVYILKNIFFKIFIIYK